MTDEPTTDRAAYYRKQAAEARAKAEAMSDYEAKTTMMEVAGIWDGLAASEQKRSHKSN